MGSAAVIFSASNVNSNQETKGNWQLPRLHCQKYHWEDCCTSKNASLEFPKDFWTLEEWLMVIVKLSLVKVYLNHGRPQWKGYFHLKRPNRTFLRVDLFCWTRPPDLFWGNFLQLTYFFWVKPCGNHTVVFFKYVGITKGVTSIQKNTCALYVAAREERS